MVPAELPPANGWNTAFIHHEATKHTKFPGKQMPAVLVHCIVFVSFAASW
jgi:hypothetical protein